MRTEEEIEIDELMHSTLKFIKHNFNNYDDKLFIAFKMN